MKRFGSYPFHYPQPVPHKHPPGLWGICHGAVMGLCLLDFWCAISIWTDSDRTGSFLHLTLIQNTHTKGRHQCYCEYQLNVIHLSVCEIFYPLLSVHVSFSLVLVSHNLCFLAGIRTRVSVRLQCRFLVVLKTGKESVFHLTDEMKMVWLLVHVEMLSEMRVGNLQTSLLSTVHDITWQT